MTDNGERKIGSLRELPLDIAPPRDLWQEIEARIAAEQGAVVQGLAQSGGSIVRGRRGIDEAPAHGRRAGRMRLLAAAAVIAALAVGIWIGRAVLPVAGKAPTAGTGLDASNVSTSTGEPGAWHAAYIVDSKYTRQRAELVKDLEKRLAALPPGSRTKVLSSLRAINDSKRDLEAELGKDPSNALLQELLVNTYQDEMRLLTAVHEAAGGGEGI